MYVCDFFSYWEKSGLVDCNETVTCSKGSQLFPLCRIGCGEGLRYVRKKHAQIWWSMEGWEFLRSRFLHQTLGADSRSRKVHLDELCTHGIMTAQGKQALVPVCRDQVLIDTPLSRLFSFFWTTNKKIIVYVRTVKKNFRFFVVPPKDTIFLVSIEQRKWVQILCLPLGWKQIS